MGSKLSIYSLFELTSGWFSTLLGHQSGVDLLSPNDPKSSDDDSFNNICNSLSTFSLKGKARKGKEIDIKDVAQ